MTHLTVLTLAVAACSPEARYQRITHRVPAPGAQLTVRDAAGARWQGVHGQASPTRAMTRDHGFLVGSNTKMITATVVLQLVDEGALALDDPAATWVDGLHPGITVRDLLQHTSGLGDYFDHPALTDDDESGAREPWTPEALRALGQEVRSDGPQSTGTYANTNFIVAGEIVEAVEERPLDEVFHDRIFAPLGMDDSGLLLSGDPAPAHLALGDGGEHGVLTRYDASVGWAAGSVYGTGADLERFLDAVMNGELLSAELHEAQHAAVPADLGFDGEGLETGYGLGLMVVRVEDQAVVGHLGNLDGFSSACFADPDTGARVVLLTNGTQVNVPEPALRALVVAGS